MSTPQEDKKKKLLAICTRLRESDPSASVLDLSAYGQLNWKEVNALCDALHKYAHLRDLNLVTGEGGINADGLLLLVPFLSTCPCLLKVRIEGSQDNTSSLIRGATSALINTLSFSESLTSIALVNVFYSRNDLLEKLLSKTQTLRDLEFSDNGAGGLDDFSQVCQSLRRGFEQNKSLESISFTSTKHGSHVETALFGLFDLSKLKSLTLNLLLTRDVSQVLGCSFKYNETLQILNLSLRSNDDHATDALAPVLLGLACNRSVKDVKMTVSHLQTVLGAAAWTELFQKNRTMQSFTLQYHDKSVSNGMNRKCATAMAVGLCENIALQELYLNSALGNGAFDGTAWQTMLQRNNSLTMLLLGGCSLGHEEEGAAAFKLFTLGLAHNTSLKRLCVGANSIGNAGGAALADALMSNATVEDLGLYDNDMVGADGQAVIRKLWSNKSLQRLDVSENCFDGPGRAFAGGLPKNQTLKVVDFCECTMNSEMCHTILESLHGNIVLKVLLLKNNNAVSLGGSCATALTGLLESTALQKLHLRGINMKSDGMTQLTGCLRSNTRLSHLDLSACGLGNDGLLELGEALVQNSTLHDMVLHENPFDEDSCQRFMQLLPRMKGLKSLRFKTSLYSKALGVELVKGLKANKSLEKIHGIVDSNLPFDMKESVEFYLKMNRNGRKFLQESKDEDAVPLPFGAWPRVLAKMTSSSERDELFHFLRHKGDLVQCPPPSRKRKASDVAPVSSD